MARCISGLVFRPFRIPARSLGVGSSLQHVLLTPNLKILKSPKVIRSQSEQICWLCARLNSILSDIIWGVVEQAELMKMGRGDQFSHVANSYEKYSKHDGLRKRWYVMCVDSLFSKDYVRPSQDCLRPCNEVLFHSVAVVSSPCIPDSRPLVSCLSPQDMDRWLWTFQALVRRQGISLELQLIGDSFIWEYPRSPCHLYRRDMTNEARTSGFPYLGEALAYYTGLSTFAHVRSLPAQSSLSPSPYVDRASAQVCMPLLPSAPTRCDGSAHASRQGLFSSICLLVRSLIAFTVLQEPSGRV